MYRYPVHSSFVSVPDGDSQECEGRAGQVLHSQEQEEGGGSQEGPGHARPTNDKVSFSCGRG